MTAPILLLTHSGDFFTIDRVEAAVKDRGGRPVRVNTDRYPVDLKLTAKFESGGVSSWLDMGTASLCLEEVHSVWSRRLWPGWLPPTLDPKFQGHCRTEARHAFLGVFGLLDHAFWINRMDRMFAAEAKLLQLKQAAQVGLQTPLTLLTNDPDRVKPFFDQVEGKMITKLLGALSQTMDGSGDFMYTSVVQPSHLETMEGLRFAAQLFQPLIEKDRELRVIVVGSKIFCGAVDVSKAQHAQVDWRKATSQDSIHWSAEELPAQLVERIHALMKRLGLVYGALDFIVDHAGQYHFLEINPAGEWGWLERDLHFPIADTLAQNLIAGAPL